MRTELAAFLALRKPEAEALQHDKGPQQTESVKPPAPEGKSALGAAWLAANFSGPAVRPSGGSPRPAAPALGVQNAAAADDRPVWQRLAPMDDWARPFIEGGSAAPAPEGAGSRLSQPEIQRDGKSDGFAGHNGISRLHLTRAQKTSRAAGGGFGALLAGAALWLAWPPQETPSQTAAIPAAFMAVAVLPDAGPSAPLQLHEAPQAAPVAPSGSAAVPAPQQDAAAPPAARPLLPGAPGQRTGVGRVAPRHMPRDRAAPGAAPRAVPARPEAPSKPEANGTKAKTPLEGLARGINAAGTGAQSGLTHLMLGVRRLFLPPRGKAT